MLCGWQRGFVILTCGLPSVLIVLMAAVPFVHCGLLLLIVSSSVNSTTHLGLTLAFVYPCITLRNDCAIGAHLRVWCVPIFLQVLSFRLHYFVRRLPLAWMILSWCFFTGAKLLQGIGVFRQIGQMRGNYSHLQGRDFVVLFLSGFDEAAGWVVTLGISSTWKVLHTLSWTNLASLLDDKELRLFRWTRPAFVIDRQLLSSLVVDCSEILFVKTGCFDRGIIYRCGQVRCNKRCRLRSFLPLQHWIILDLLAKHLT